MSALGDITAVAGLALGYKILKGLGLLGGSFGSSSGSTYLGGHEAAQQAYNDARDYAVTNNTNMPAPYVDFRTGAGGHGDTSAKDRYEVAYRASTHVERMTGQGSYGLLNPGPGGAVFEAMKSAGVENPTIVTERDLMHSMEVGDTRTSGKYEVVKVF